MLNRSLLVFHPTILDAISKINQLSYSKLLDWGTGKRRGDGCLLTPNANEYCVATILVLSK